MNILAAHHKLRLIDRRRYEQYLRQALQPMIWLPMREAAGTIATNRMYAGGQGPELNTGPNATSDHAGEADATTGFASVNGAILTSQEVDVAVGGSALDIATDDGGISDRAEFPKTLEVSSTYRAMFRAKAVIGAAAQQWVGFTSSPSQAIAADWTPYSFDRICTSASAILRFYATGGVGSIFRLDDLRLFKIGELDALIAGTTSLGQTGLRGVREAFLFDGATSILTVPNRASIQGLTDFTLWMLFRPTSAGEGGAGVLFEKAGEFQLRFNGSSRDLIATVNYDSTNGERVTSTTLSANQWHSVGMRIDDATKTPAIFVDGVEAAYASTTAGVGDRASTTNNLIIGNNAAVSATLAGLVDEAALFPHTLADDSFRLLHTLI